MSLVLSDSPDYTTPPIPLPGSRVGIATMTVVCRKAVSIGVVEPIAFGRDGWEIPATRPSGTGDALWMGVVKEAVAASRDASSHYRRKVVGERIEVQVSGLYRGATIPSTLTPTNTNRYIGYTGASAALAVGSSARNDAAFAEALAPHAAGTVKDIRLFGRMIYT